VVEIAGKGRNGNWWVVSVLYREPMWLKLPSHRWRNPDPDGFSALP